MAFIISATEQPPSTCCEPLSAELGLTRAEAKRALRAADVTGNAA